MRPRGIADQIALFGGFGLTTTCLEMPDNGQQGLGRMACQWAAIWSQQGTRLYQYGRWARRDERHRYSASRSSRSWTDWRRKPRRKSLNVACSDGGKPRCKTFRCRRQWCQGGFEQIASIPPTKGAPELKTFWRDPEHKAGASGRVFLCAGAGKSSGVPAGSTWDAFGLA